MKTNKGIIAGIFKGPHGSSDGIANFSSRVDRVVVISSQDFKVDEVFTPDYGMPAVMVVKRFITSHKEPYLTAYPVTEDGVPDTHCMFGGCYISSSDSRIKAISQYPIPLHDRRES